MYLIPNGSFEHGLTGWRPVNQANSVKMSVVQAGAGASGSSFLRATTTVANGSVAIDFTAALPVFTHTPIQRHFMGPLPPSGEWCGWRSLHKPLALTERKMVLHSPFTEEGQPGTMLV
jgi:hypothetical protein